MFALYQKPRKIHVVKNDIMFRKFGSVEACINDERISKHRLLGPMVLRLCDFGNVQFATQTTISLHDLNQQERRKQ